MKTLAIDVWSDIACPWCYIGKRRLEAALQRFPERDRVRLRWHAFELDPNAPPTRPSTSHTAELAAKYGVSVAQAEAMIARVVDAAAKDGLDFHFERLQPGNTFDAHRIIALAFARGGAAAQVAMTERLMRAYLTDGEALGDRDTLVRLGVDIGLAADDVRAVFDGSAFAEDVREDERVAREIGITGVPCFVLDEQYGVTGAQPAELLLQALTQAWAGLSAEATLEDSSATAAEGTVTEGDACDIDGCA